MPPCLLARFLLEHLVGVPRGALGACLKNPACIPSTPVFFVEGKSATNKRATAVQAGADVALRAPPPGTALRGETDATSERREGGKSPHGIGKKSSAWGLGEDEGTPDASDRATERLPPGADRVTAGPIRGSQDKGVPRGPNQEVPAGAVGADGKETGGGVEVAVDRIRGDVYRCVENDSVSSPAVEVIRRVAGLG